VEEDRDGDDNATTCDFEDGKEEGGGTTTVEDEDEDEETLSNLQTFTTSKDGMTLVDVAKVVGLPASSVAELVVLNNKYIPGIRRTSRLRIKTKVLYILPLERRTSGR
jgi:hypothetical protein